MQRIIVVGSSGQSRVVCDILRTLATFEIAGLLDDFRPAGELVDGVPILGKIADLKALIARHGITAAFPAIGDNFRRAGAVDRLREEAPGLIFPAIVHPSAQVSPRAAVLQGTVVMPGAVINAGAQVGEFCIVNTNASLDHDSRMERFSSLAPGATVGGNVQIGAFAALGLSAGVIHQRQVGEHAVIGAGAVVVRDIPPNVVAYGIPARVIRTRAPGEPYL